MDWNPDQRYWERRQKHMPVPHVDWKDVVKSTKQGDAHYKPNMTEEEIKKIEMDCVTHGTELPGTHPSRKRYFLRYDTVIGSSKGEETTIVYSEWARSGAVHGRPITEGELKKKGMP